MTLAVSPSLFTTAETKRCYRDVQNVITRFNESVENVHSVYVKDCNWALNALDIASMLQQNRLKDLQCLICVVIQTF